jgi:Cu-Zn family superoxide dismutase
MEKPMKSLIFSAGATATLTLLSAGAAAQQPTTDLARAELADTNGNSMGTVEFTQSPNGVWVRATLTGLPGGTHGFHIHETGKCEPPFESAGGHYNPAGAEHGFMVEGGPHAGDMPNLNVPESGEATFEAFVLGLSISGEDAQLLDEDGSAVVVHSGADDYSSQPSGDAGDRIACGVVETFRGAAEGTQ